MIDNVGDRGTSLWVGMQQPADNLVKAFGNRMLNVDFGVYGLLRSFEWVGEEGKRVEKYTQ
jgi:hypothetical protein